MPTRSFRYQQSSSCISWSANPATHQSGTSHWNYDRPAFHAALREADRFDSPEFFPKNSFYTVAPGGQSCYGDQVLAVARHLVSCKHPLSGAASQAALVDRLETSFGPGSAYGPWPVDGKPSMPIPGPWRHGSRKGFLTKLGEGQRAIPSCGSDDSQADCFAKAVPVVCAFAGHPELPSYVETVVRCTQNSDIAVQYALAAARVLEACILGCGGADDALVAAIEGAAAEGAAAGGAAAEGAAAGGAAAERAAAEGAAAEGAAASMQPAAALRLILEMIEMKPPTFEQGVAALGADAAMKPLLSSPVSLVA